METNYKYFYVCDGEACKRQCRYNGYSTCTHTGDESHALHKVRRDRKFEKYGTAMAMTEILKDRSELNLDCEGGKDENTHND